MNNLGSGGYDYGTSNMEFSTTLLPTTESRGLPLQRSDLHGSLPLGQTNLHRPFTGHDSQTGLGEVTNIPQFPVGYPNTLFPVPGMQGFTNPEAFQQMFSFQQMTTSRLSTTHNLSSGTPISQNQQYNKHGSIPVSSTAVDHSQYTTSSPFNITPQIGFGNSNNSNRSVSSPVTVSRSGLTHSLSLPVYSSTSSRLDDANISMFSPIVQASGDSCVMPNSGSEGTLDLSSQMLRTSQPLNIPHLSSRLPPQHGVERNANTSLASDLGVPQFSSIGSAGLPPHSSLKLNEFDSTSHSRSTHIDLLHRAQGHHSEVKEKLSTTGHPTLPVCDSVPVYYQDDEQNKELSSESEDEDEEEEEKEIEEAAMTEHNLAKYTNQTVHNPFDSYKPTSEAELSSEDKASIANVHFLLKGRLSENRKITNFKRAFMEAADIEDCSLNDDMTGFPFKDLIVMGSFENKSEQGISVKKELEQDKKILPPHLKYRKQEREKQHNEGVKFGVVQTSQIRNEADSSSKIISLDEDYSNDDDDIDESEKDEDEGDEETRDKYGLGDFKYTGHGSQAVVGDDRTTENVETDKWFGASILSKYNSLEDGCYENSHFESPTKGKRSDPSHPFAITSPSFKESAARALVTTTVADNATIVTISIMSIGNKKKMIPKIVSSPAAAGGLVSVVNLDESLDRNSEDQSASLDSEVKSDRTSIMSKLKRSKKEKEIEDEEPEIGRVDVNIRINDSQLVCHGDQKRWQCTLCPKSYTTKHNLVAHILDHSSIKPHLCLMCGKYFKQLSHLNTHMLTHDNVKPHICQICNKGFTQISHLKRHQAVHLDNKPYICDICNRGFAYPSELRIHKDKHIPGKDKCVDCGAEFTTSKELREHMLTHEHRNNLTCKHCDRVFRFPSQLKDHMITHAGARPYICTECGMDFMKEHHLKAHQFTHTGLRPYACPDCSRSFNQKANMVRHMLIHNAERAYKCEVCDKTFTQPQTLKAHMVVHAERKPFSCKFCGKQFGRLHNLQGHMHMHNNSKPYICFCGSSFTLKGNLNRHKKVKHGLNESTESMEEDAVNFLSSLSERVRDSDDVQDDTLDTSRDEIPSPESKLLKKGRKSVPRKMIQPTTVDVDGEMVLRESGTEADDNVTEEEADGTEESDHGVVSQYFNQPDQTQSMTESRRKRKREVCYRVKDADEHFQDVNENENEYDEEEDYTEVGRKGKRSLRYNPERMNLRKRRRKGPTPDEDFDCSDDVECAEEELEDEDENNPDKVKKTSSKGAKLDSLIATKFKTV